MRAFTLEPRPPLLFGEGASRKTGEVLKKLGSKRAMICCDKGVKNAGLVDPIAQSISEEGIEICIFDGVVPNPTESSVYDGSDRFAAFQGDAIVAIGGGSAMDTAKAISLLTANPRPLSQYYLGPGMRTPNKKSNLLVHIPTTSGTGAEMATGGIITSDATGFKMVIMGPQLAAQQAILDPLLTVGLPKFTTAITGLDAMSHAFDGIFTTGRSVMSDIYMSKAIELIWNYLPLVVNENPADLEGRGAMCLGACLPLLYDGINWSHAFAHTFSNLFHNVPHGLACAWAFPCYVKWMVPLRREESRIIAGILGVDPGSQGIAQEIYEKLIAFIKTLGIPAPKDFEGVDYDTWTGAADLVMAETPYLFSEDRPDREECLKLLEEMYHALD